MLDALARWAAELDAAALPADVEAHARLLHLSLAGALRRARSLPVAQAALRQAGAGGTPLLGGTERVGVTDAVRYYATVAAAQDFADTVFNSPAALGAISASWALGGTAREQLLATVAGIEVAARIGAAALLARSQGDALGCVHAVSTAVAAGRRMGLDGVRMGHAIGLALAGAAVLPNEVLFASASARGEAVAGQVLVGLHAAEQARKGATGSPDVLESRTFGELGCGLPLRAALEGAGEIWYLRAAVFKSLPGANSVQVPVQAVHEILRRHVKAAEKRLRTDQVERVTLRVAAPGWAGEQLAPAGWDPGFVTRSIARSVAALTTAYELGSTQLDPAFLNGHAEVLTDIAQRVEIEHSWAFTIDGMAHLAQVAGPLFAGCKAGELARALRGMGGAWPSPPLPRHPRELVEIAKFHPERLFLAQVSGSFDPAAWRCPQRVEVKLYTSRGGWWPERRDAPEGMGWPQDKLLRMLESKWAGDGPPPVLPASGADGEAWLRALGGV